MIEKRRIFLIQLIKLLTQLVPLKDKILKLKNVHLQKFKKLVLDFNKNFDKIIDSSEMKIYRMNENKLSVKDYFSLNMNGKVGCITSKILFITILKIIYCETKNNILNFVNLIYIKI